jgi:hypothetical protein
LQAYGPFSFIFIKLEGYSRDFTTSPPFSQTHIQPLSPLLLPSSFSFLFTHTHAQEGERASQIERGRERENEIERESCRLKERGVAGREKERKKERMKKKKKKSVKKKKTWRRLWPWNLEW